ncbi:MAG: hypothetical protein K0S44_2306 [Bacteroidetes bacterium]|nr:hypothetical protein [Bacteroidota bacterium]
MLSTLSFNFKTFGQEVWTIGPMLHYNFGGEKRHVLEINRTEHKAHLGFQTTFWVNYFIGVDYRYRRIDKTNFNCIGTYGKLPFATKDIESSDGNSNYDWD